MENTSNRNLWAWALVAGVLLFMCVISAGVLWFVRDAVQTAQNAVQPVNEMTSNLGTQVAEVLNPTPTVLPDPVTIIRSVRSLARLETIQYSVEKVITAETGQGTFGFLFGDRLIFVAHGTVIAGIDLGKLGPENMWVDNNVLYVRLPEPEIFVATLDNEQSYVYDREQGALTRGDVNLETTARQAAEAEIRDAALEDGILQQAGQNSEAYLSRLFLELGYPEVIFVGATPIPDITPEATPVLEATPTPEVEQ